MPPQDSSNSIEANYSPPPASQCEAMMVAVGFRSRSTRRAALSRVAPSASPRPRLNANGVPSQSPGLRGTSYPGLNPINRSQPQRGCGNRVLSSRHNPVGVDPSAPCFPKVARPSQPWAGGHNPVGIETTHHFARHRVGTGIRGLKARHVKAWAGEPQARRPRLRST